MLQRWLTRCGRPEVVRKVQPKKTGSAPRNNCEPVRNLISCERAGSKIVVPAARGG